MSAVTSTASPAVDLVAVKTRQQAAWSTGNYAVVGTTLQIVGENLREALGYDAHLRQAHYQLGRVLEMQGNYQAAVQSLNQAIALQPSYPEPHYLLGRIYHRLGEDQLSKKEIAQFQELKKAIEAPPVVGPFSSPK